MRGAQRVSIASKDKPIVIALGGNAISPPGREGNVSEQFNQTRLTVEILADLYMTGHQLVLTHGNGPQVGNILHRVELAVGEVYALPLHVCVADTQAGMGYMIAQCMNNALTKRGLEPAAGTLITTVLVDENDSAFERPTKPIGRFYNREKMESLVERFGWAMKEIEPGQWRRVVPSPRPRHIFELEMIRSLIKAGHLMVVAGGGGVPVVRRANGDLDGVEAVVDKDHSSALLALELDVEIFVMVTGVDRVKVDFGKPHERALDQVDTKELRRYLETGQFPAGSMGPKVEAALRFLEESKNDNARVIIADLVTLGAALQGQAGTQITR